MLFDRVKQLCKQNEITITELERILKFGNGTIHKWNTTTPSVEKVKMVANHFDVGIDFLIGESPILSNESMEIARKYSSYSEEKKNLLRCYILMIENSKTG